MNTSVTTQRFDPITPVHKAMRHFMFDVLTQVGSLDVSDIFAVDRCAKQVARLVRVLPNAADTLAPLLHDLRQRDMSTRRDASNDLYRQLTAMVTSQLVAQQELETARTPMLWVQYTDEDLGDIRRKQIAAMSEEDLADALRWMGVALAPQELASFVTDLQASVDAQMFDCLLDTLRRDMELSRWERVARELGLPGAESAGAERTGARVEHDREGHHGEPLRRLHRSDRHRMRAQ